jgi:hypothetical protein
MSTKNLIDLQQGNGEQIEDDGQDEPNLQSMGLDDSEDIDLLNDDYDDVTEIESQNVEDNLDDLQALISDTQSKLFTQYQLFFTILSNFDLFRRERG